MKTHINGVSLQQAAEDLLAQYETAPPRVAGEPLRPRDELRILVLVREQGQTQEQAAEAVGCDQSTVSRVLARYDDTRPLARKRLEAAALDVAERAIREGDPLKLLQKLDVLREDREQPPNPYVGFAIGLQLTIEQQRALLPDFSQKAVAESERPRLNAGPSGLA